MSVCADYLIETPLMRVTRADRDQAIALLRRIVAGAVAIGAGAVSLPMLENNAALNGGELSDVLRALDDVIRAAAEKGVRIALEIDLEVNAIIEPIDRAGVGVCYDLGNAAAAGRDIASELSTLGDRVAVVHVKDRIQGGASVRLGDGSVAFARAFAALQATGYAGPLILETPRGDSPVDAARGQLAFVKQQLETAALA
jgi:sugar phosphate isomerase/epimerase